MTLGPLWTCPKCGAKLITRNLAHSCGKATVQDWLDRASPRARRLYRAFERLIARCGPYHVAPAKTRIGFLARVRFAGITALSDTGMTCNFALPYPIRHPRFLKVEEVVPGWWVHRLRITEPNQLDGTVEEWIRESYRLMGLQERLDRSTGRPGGKTAGRLDGSAARHPVARRSGNRPRSGGEDRR